MTAVITASLIKKDCLSKVYSFYSVIWCVGANLSHVKKTTEAGTSGRPSVEQGREGACQKGTRNVSNSIILSVSLSEPLY